ncbi:hypothetical protein IW140_005806 [Coemansia sp. RSA 1813]|nr:hypothetical protein EV178_005845 [Coemansia sp. RSA 1646]KAJ1767843.1 hypothetical protein LPJ74_005145 [Coemansia sp. RSA 1843]KAJ2211033.1 hypothetical protein EV179_005807 [Coemansia sp. RSA 487]KAJ2564280.1 hypothetical protein IW140_005806 [Coemansia sp. RSA 1813]
MTGKAVAITGSSAQSGGTATEENKMDVENRTTSEETKRQPAHIEKIPESLAQRSVEGWVVVATGIHEEAREDDLQDFFGDYGRVHNLHLNLDRQTGYVKGYALIEFSSFEEATRAVEKASGKKFLGQPIAVDFAFVKDEGGRGRQRSSHQAQDDDGEELDERENRRRANRKEPTIEPCREESPDRGF